MIDIVAVGNKYDDDDEAVTGPDVDLLFVR